MLLDSRTTLASRALPLTAPNQFMTLGAARPRPTVKRGVGMYARGAIGPIPAPDCAGDEHAVCGPDDARGARSPGAKCEAYRDAKSKADGAAHEESGGGGSENDQRVIHC